MSDNKQNLFKLEDLPDYTVATDYSDVRGWDVIDAENRTIGKVEHLLVNKTSERVVYLDVEVDKTLIEVGYNSYQMRASDGVHGFVNQDGDDHLIIPIGMVSIDAAQKKVFSSQIDYNTFAKAKRFNKETVIDREYELMLFRHYSGDDLIDITTIDDNFYGRKEFLNSLHPNNA